jgi:hypothetical protein
MCLIGLQDGLLKHDVREPNPSAVRKLVRILLGPPPPIEAIQPPKVGCKQCSRDARVAGESFILDVPADAVQTSGAQPKLKHHVFLTSQVCPASRRTHSQLRSPCAKRRRKRRGPRPRRTSRPPRPAVTRRCWQRWLHQMGGSPTSTGRLERPLSCLKSLTSCFLPGCVSQRPRERVSWHVLGRRLVLFVELFIDAHLGCGLTKRLPECPPATSHVLTRSIRSRET